jgi:uncharacterized RmlC-like cupin family protein
MVHTAGHGRQHFEAMAARTQQSWASSGSTGHRHHLQRTFSLAGTPAATSSRIHSDQESCMVTETEYPPIRIVSPGKFDSGTAQTPGSLRLAAVAPQLGVQSTMWGGLFEVKPGARTGIHHHGEQQTIAYVLSGVCEIRWGARGEYVARAKAGDFIHVPAFLPHMEINPSDSEPFRWVVVRSTSTPIVVNLPDQTWQSAA